MKIFILSGCIARSHDSANCLAESRKTLKLILAWSYYQSNWPIHFILEKSECFYHFFFIYCFVRQLVILKIIVVFSISPLLRTKFSPYKFWNMLMQKIYTKFFMTKPDSTNSNHQSQVKLR